MKYFRVTLFRFPVFLLTACVATSAGPSLPLPAPGSDTPPRSQPGHENRVTSWKFTPVAQPQTYSSILTTIVTQADIPATTTRRDSLITRALYSINTIRAIDSVLFSGSITDFKIRGNTTDFGEADLITPISFTGRLTGHNIIIRLSNSNQVQDQNDCANSAQTALRVVQRNFFTLPPEIATEQSWTDSTSSVTCNGTLPITQVVIRTLTVLGDSELEGSPVLVLNQNEKTFAKGEGSQGQHRISIESQGLTSGRLYLDRVSGQLLASNSTNKSSLSIQSSGRVQHFIQNSTEITQKIR